ncbi:nucleotidyltransferase domain-containing protein [bacterium]|nr:nucleotidyltransferase domain-containing protein [bacterium]
MNSRRKSFQKQKIDLLLDRMVKKAKEDKQILALLLFGSRAREDSIKASDIDICLVLMPGSYTPLNLSQKRLTYLKSFDLDIQIFQQLPLYIKVRVLKEGRVLFCRDEDNLYNISFSTIQEFSDFEHIYREYLKEVAHAG